MVGMISRRMMILQNGDMSSGIGLINSHTLSQFNEFCNLNETNWGVKNGDVSVGNCCINSHTIYKAINNNYTDSTNNRDERFPTYLKYKILDYRMVLTLILCYLHPQFINMQICNAITIITTPRWKLENQNQTINQFLHQIQLLLLQETTNYVY